MRNSNSLGNKKKANPLKKTGSSTKRSNEEFQEKLKRRGGIGNLDALGLRSSKLEPRYEQIHFPIPIYHGRR